MKKQVNIRVWLYKERNKYKRGLSQPAFIGNPDYETMPCKRNRTLLVCFGGTPWPMCGVVLPFSKLMDLL